MAEIVTRMALDPANHASLSPVPDDTLGTRVPDGALGYDDWGFRNREIPDKADIVTIGDSQTFGINASVGSDWPGQLEDMSNNEVYNLSAEGYGPVQYYHLFKTKGLKLQPDRVIVGYYIGNDPLDSYEMTYNHKTWSKLRSEDFSAGPDTTLNSSLDLYLSNNASARERNLVSSLKSWLAGKSMLYRLGFHNDNVRNFPDLVQEPAENHIQRASYPSLNIPERNINETFTTVHQSYKMDVHNKKIQEGLRVTFELFKKMKQKSEEMDIEFTVLLIPTKEMVFSHYLFNNDQVKYSGAIDKLLNNERMIREISMKYFMANDIKYIDALPTMQQAIEEDKIYAPSDTNQPNVQGYQLIAKSFYKYLESNQIASK